MRALFITITDSDQVASGSNRASSLILYARTDSLVVTRRLGYLYQAELSLQIEAFQLVPTSTWLGPDVHSMDASMWCPKAPWKRWHL